MKLNGKIGIVTGAGSGVGLAAAELFASAGCQVIATARKVDQLEVLSSKHGICAAELDVTSEKQWKSVTDMAVERFGGIDLIFNNAGVTVRGGILDMDINLWNHTLLTNLTSVFLGCRAVIPKMLSRGGGAIVNHASINALQGNTNLVAYCASKAGVTGLTRALAIDYADKGIRVNSICSAAIDTPMTQSYLGSVEDPDAMREAIKAKHPIGRMATADEVAQVALFLVSPVSSYITGASIPVDGGRSVR
jgi:NAD(P)-dependent dehydrogenase (short-subunit alcohol dehydrogenase family)